MAVMNTSSAVSAQLSVANMGKKANTEDEMSQQAFLTLFTTQLQNQNPLDPVKNEAFVAQLAQFSQLEATTKMSDSLASMNSTMQGDRLMTGAALIGKKVASPNGTAELVDGANVAGVLSLANGANSVNLDVYDTNGAKVFSQTMGRQQPGDLTVRWDGFNSQGERMPAGRYKVVATVDAFGEISQVPISTPSTVKSVTYTNNELMLELNDGSSVPLSGVQRIDS
jgi:flagellar basal-body rod modification protein FlgD